MPETPDVHVPRNVEVCGSHDEDARRENATYYVDACNERSAARLQESRVFSDTLGEVC